MKRIDLFFIAIIMVTITGWGCGGGRHSSIEGKLVDGKGQPVAGVKIVAVQEQPIKGYEQFEAVTMTDGSFRIDGLFPSSIYVIKPWSDKWSSKTKKEVESAPEGETAILPKPLVIELALSNNGGGLVMDLATGATRFSVSAEGVISDAISDLDWVVGPVEEHKVDSVEQWVSTCSVGGGGWRMPTSEELENALNSPIGIDPSFMLNGKCFWAKDKGRSASVYSTNFSFGYPLECLHSLATDGNSGYYGQILGVRRHYDQSYTLYLKGLASEDDNDYNKAIEYYSNAIKLKNDETYLYSARASAYRKLNMDEDALKDYLVSIKLDKDDIGAYVSIAYAYSSSKNTKLLDGKKALYYSQIAVSIAPDDDGVLQSLAAAYARDGQFEKALEAQQKALEIAMKKPDFSENYNKMIQKKLNLYKGHNPYTRD